MSESKEYIKEFEALIKQKPILEAELEGLKGEISTLSEEVKQLKADREKILAKYKKAEDEGIARVQQEKADVDQVLSQEAGRIEESNIALELREANASTRETVLDQNENEYADKNTKLLAFGKKLKHLELDLKELQETLDEKEERIDGKIAKLNSMIDHNNEIASGAALSLLDANKAEANVRGSQEEAINEQARLEGEEKRLKAWERKLAKDQKDLDGVAEDLRLKASENEANMNLVSKKQKDANDKERANRAMQVDLDFKLAKLKKAGKE